VILLALLALQAGPTLPSSPDPMPPSRSAPTAQAAPPPAPPPVSTDPAVEARYRACTDQIRTNAEAAVAAADAWRAEGGGVPARLCLGLALSALERWPQAATAFEQAAREAESARDPRRADFQVQSGNAWLAGGEPARALQAFDAALATPGLGDARRGEVHVDRAAVLVAQNNVAAARADIDRALQLIPEESFAWFLSAALAQRELNLSRAGTDIARARQLAPEDPDILLYAGTLAGLAGDMEEAERLYRLVVRLAPDSEAGRQAQVSLATMREVEVPAPTPAPPSR
jgi:tetratricopeptide (TPR) repeat protein